MDALRCFEEDDADSSAAAFDASEGVEVVPVEHKHDLRVDKAMALWAQAAVGEVVVGFQKCLEKSLFVSFFIGST